MVIKTKLIGTGKRGDAYRVSLPTYRVILGNVTDGYALVDVPDDVHGLTEDDLAHENKQETTEGFHYPKLCDDCIDKVHRHLDATYQEHKGEFRVEQV